MRGQVYILQVKGKVEYWSKRGYVLQVVTMAGTVKATD